MKTPKQGPKESYLVENLQEQEAYLETLLHSKAGLKLPTETLLEYIQISKISNIIERTNALHKFNQKLFSILNKPLYQVVPSYVQENINTRLAKEAASEQIKPFSFTESILSGKSKRLYDLINDAYPNFFKELDSEFEKIDISEFHGKKQNQKITFKLMDRLNALPEINLVNLDNTNPQKNRLLSYITQQPAAGQENANPLDFNNITTFVPLILSGGEKLPQVISIGFHAETGKPIIYFE